MPKIIWSDGVTYRGATWEAAFDNCRADQWLPYTREEFRQVLVDRAYAWSGGRTTIDPTLPYLDLFRALERIGVLTVHLDEEEH